jgi:hypothetical protein
MRQESGGPTVSAYRTIVPRAEEGSMTDPTTQYAAQKQHSTHDQGPNAWAVGGVTFAAFMMMLVGVFQMIAGVVALFENEFYAVTPNYVFEFDVTTWGWIHLLLGAVVGLAGFGVLRGNLAARMLGIALAALSGVANFLFIPYYPFWSITIIAVDIFVIWALAAHGKEFKR